MRKVVIRFLVLAIALCGVCGFLVGCNQENEECTNHVEKWLTDKQATCLEQGIKHAECENCGKYLGVQSIDALGHSFLNYVLDNNATCEENGTKTATCENEGCSEKDTKTIENSALDHSYGDWVSNGNGTHTKTCARDSSHVVTENCTGGTATCTQKATCATCGNEYGDLKDHEYNTLKKSDTQHWYECVCGDKSGIENHKGGTATCTEQATCATCGNEYGDLKDHQYSTLKKSDTEHWYECECGAYETKENHKPGAAATETTDQTCTVCGHIITPALGHVHTAHLTKVDAKPQSCTKEGNTLYYTCSCGKWFTDNTANTEITDKVSVIIGKDNHQYNTLKKSETQHWYECSCGAYETKENHKGGTATCQVKASCSVCGTVYGNYGGHVYNQTNVDSKYLVSDKTCTEQAKYNYSCICGEKSDTIFYYGSVLGHSWGEWESNNNDTHTRVCIRDSKHTETKNCSGGTATCTEKAICKDCGKTHGDFAEHPYSSQYTYNDTHHWQDSTCDCGVKKNLGEHTPDSSGWCTVCDKVIKATEGLLYDYSADGTFAELIGYSGTSKRVNIASTYEGLPVKTICDRVFENSNITTVIIPDSVTSIEKAAFYSCDALTSIEIPNSVVSIGDSAFDDCRALKVIEIPSSVISIGDNAFAVCVQLTDVTFAQNSKLESIGEFAFDGCEQLKSITIPDSTKIIGNDAFDWCTSLTSVTLGNSLVSIGAGAFYCCSLLPSIEIPNSVTSIGWAAFNGCSSLTSVTLGNGVKTIDERAFANCYLLSEVIIPNSITKMGVNVFENCTSLTYNTEGNINYLGNESNTYLVAVSLDNSNFASYAVNSNTKVICEKAFSGCTRIANLEIPFVGASVSATEIEDTSFEYIFDTWYNFEMRDELEYYLDVPTTLKNVVITGGEKINSSAFSDCKFIETIRLPNTLTSISDWAFSGCSSLKAIEIPDSVQYIGGSAFSGCSSLESLKIPFIGEKADGTGNLHFEYIFDTYAGGYYDEPNVPSSLIKVVVTGGKGVADYAFANCGFLEEIELPNTMTSIGQFAFFNCSALKSMSIPSGVTSIGADAFYGCNSLTSVTIPSGVTTIQPRTFYGCTSLTSATIPSSVTKIGEHAFYGCSFSQGYEKDGLRYLGDDDNNYLYLAGAVSKDIVTANIDSNCKFIGSGAFADCSSLTTVSIPDSVVSIESGTFSGCTNLQYTIERGNKYLGNESNPYLCLVSGNIESDARGPYDKIYIADGCKIIMGGAFGYVMEVDLYIPKSVVVIGANNFEGWVVETHYGGTAEDWAKIEIGSGNTELTYRSNIIYNSYYYPQNT